MSALKILSILLLVLMHPRPATAVELSVGNELHVSGDGAYYRKDLKLNGSEGVRLRYRFEGLPLGGHNYVGVDVGGRYIELGFSDADGNQAQPHMRQQQFKIDFQRSEAWIRDEKLNTGEPLKARFRPGGSGYFLLPTDAWMSLHLKVGDTVEQTVSGVNPMINSIVVIHLNGSRTLGTWRLYFKGLPSNPSSGALKAQYRVVLATAKARGVTLTASTRAERVEELKRRRDAISIHRVRVKNQVSAREAPFFSSVDSTLNLGGLVGLCP